MLLTLAVGVAISILTNDVERAVLIFARWMARRLAARLTGALAERYAEEWVAEIHADGTRLGMVLFVFGLVWRSRKIAAEAEAGKDFLGKRVGRTVDVKVEFKASAGVRTDAGAVPSVGVGRAVADGLAPTLTVTSTTVHSTFQVFPASVRQSVPLSGTSSTGTRTTATLSEPGPDSAPTS